MSGPVIRLLDALPPTVEVRPQMHGGRRAAVHIRVVEDTPDLRVLYTRYDPGLVVERHSHAGDEVIHVLEGAVVIGDVPCPAGATIVLRKGTPFGPLVAGEEGTVLFEVFIGRGASATTPEDPAGFRELLKSRGITGC